MKPPSGKYLVFVFASLLPLCSFSQANSDCGTATSVCNAVYDEQDSPSGTGAVFEVAPGSCQTGGEFNSAWYVFSPQDDGNLSFLLNPNSNNDDYDWSLFDITENGCAGINNGLSPEISCNSYGETGGFQGPTGISSADGGSGSVNGPGNVNGPPFNADVFVTAGNVYALVVMNYSSTLNGYELDFGDSDASIYDDDAPVMTSLTNNWCTGEIVMTFSENIDVGALNLADFQIEEAGYTLNSFEADAVGFSNTLTFSLGQVPLTDNITLHLSTTNGAELMDLCGNAVVLPLTLELNGDFEYEITTTPGCNNLGATLDLNNLQNDLYPPYSTTVNGVNAGSFPVQDVDSGNTVVVVTDDLGCTITQSINVVNQVAIVTLPSNETLCSMSGTFVADYTGSNFQWEPSNGLNFSSTSSVSTFISATEPGPYIITATVWTADCIASATMEVIFNYPPAIDISTAGTSCFGICDGTIEIVNGNPAPLTVSFTGHQETGEQMSFNDLCGGDYVMEVLHSPECTAYYEFNIAEPAQVIAAVDVSKWIVSLETPETVLTDQSINADSIYWYVEGINELYSAESVWNLQLPFEAGIYWINLEASDLNGCADFLRFSVEVRDEFRFYIPNCFTPNGDGVNDNFFIAFSYPPVEMKFYVFNRLGQKVFETDDYEKVWTGNFLGGEYFCENGVYSWQLTTRGVELEEQVYTGHLTIAR